MKQVTSDRILNVLFSAALDGQGQGIGEADHKQPPPRGPAALTDGTTTTFRGICALPPAPSNPQRHAPGRDLVDSPAAPAPPGQPASGTGVAEVNGRTAILR